MNASVLPLWVRVWRRLPLLDRYAYQWMWHHGGWLVEPAGRGTGGGDPAEDRAPLHPVQPNDQAAVALPDPSAPDTQQRGG